MLTMEDTVEIKVLHKQGKSIRAIARETGFSRNTVRTYLRTEKEPEYKRRAPRPSKLDDYKQYIKERIESARPHAISAVVLLREIRDQGYQGQLTILRQFLRKMQHTEPEEIKRYETEPGEQMQVDWWVARSGKKPLYCFAAVLGYSRKLYVEFVETMEEEQLLNCHQNAFEYFGGVPEKGLYDNMKTVVIKRDKYGKGAHGYQKTFADFAKHYGFIPKLCRPYRPQTKGKVERHIQYVQRNFYYPLITQKEVDLIEINYEAKKWLRDIANKRYLRARGKKVDELYLQEAAKLKPIAPNYLSAKPTPRDIEVKQHSLMDYERLEGYA